MHKEIIIIIPYYNNRTGLEKSIASIKEKINIDVIIIDDGSKNKLDVIRLKKNYKAGEIFYKKHKQNKGIAISLNIGLEFAREQKYKYIARLDAGDLCYKNKFKLQHRYLKKNPEVKLLGTWARVIDDKGKHLFDLKHPIKYKKIKKLIYLNSVFLHPSVMFSSSVLREVKQYPLNYFAAEDYAFFFKIIKKFKSENYPEILMDYIVDKNSISSKFRRQQVISRIKIILKNFYFGIYPIYGIIRSVMLLLPSREISNFIKRKIQTS